MSTKPQTQADLLTQASHHHQQLSVIYAMLHKLAALPAGTTVSQHEAVLAEDGAALATRVKEEEAKAKPAPKTVDAVVDPPAKAEPKVEAKAAPPTVEDVRQALAAWAKGNGGNSAALTKLTELGFKNCSTIPEAQRAAVIAKLKA